MSLVRITSDGRESVGYLELSLPDTITLRDTLAEIMGRDSYARVFDTVARIHQQLQGLETTLSRVK